MRRTFSLLIALLLITSSAPVNAQPKDFSQGAITPTDYTNPSAYPAILSNPSFDPNNAPADMLQQHASSLSPAQVRTIADPQRAMAVMRGAPSQTRNLPSSAISTITNAQWTELGAAVQSQLVASQLSATTLNAIRTINALDPLERNNAIRTLHPGVGNLLIDQNSPEVNYDNGFLQTEQFAGCQSRPNACGVNLNNIPEGKVAFINAIIDNDNAPGFLVQYKDARATLVVGKAEQVTLTAEGAVVRDTSGKDLLVIQGKISFAGTDPEGNIIFTMDPATIVRAGDVVLTNHRAGSTISVLDNGITATGHQKINSPIVNGYNDGGSLTLLFDDQKNIAAVKATRADLSFTHTVDGQRFSDRLTGGFDATLSDGKLIGGTLRPATILRGADGSIWRADQELPFDIGATATPAALAIQQLAALEKKQQDAFDSARRTGKFIGPDGNSISCGNRDCRTQVAAAFDAVVDAARSSVIPGIHLVRHLEGEPGKQSYTLDDATARGKLAFTHGTTSLDIYNEQSGLAYRPNVDGKPQLDVLRPSIAGNDNLAKVQMRTPLLGPDGSEAFTDSKGGIYVKTSQGFFKIVDGRPVKVDPPADLQQPTLVMTLKDDNGLTRANAAAASFASLDAINRALKQADLSSIGIPAGTLFTNAPNAIINFASDGKALAATNRYVTSRLDVTPDSLTLIGTVARGGLVSLDGLARQLAYESLGKARETTDVAIANAKTDAERRLALAKTETAYRDLLDIAPDAASILTDFSNFLLGQGRTEDAEQYAAKAVDTINQLKALRESRIASGMRAEDVDAMPDMRQLSQLNALLPQAVKIQNAINNQLAIKAMQDGRYSEAVRRGFAAETPNVKNLIDALAQLEQEGGDMTDALRKIISVREGVGNELRKLGIPENTVQQMLKQSSGLKEYEIARQSIESLGFDNYRTSVLRRVSERESELSKARLAGDTTTIRRLEQDVASAKREANYLSVYTSVRNNNAQQQQLRADIKDATDTQRELLAARSNVLQQKNRLLILGADEFTRRDLLEAEYKADKNTLDAASLRQKYASSAYALAGARDTSVALEATRLLADTTDFNVKNAPQTATKMSRALTATERVVNQLERQGDYAAAQSAREQLRAIEDKTAPVIEQIAASTTRAGTLGTTDGVQQLNGVAHLVGDLSSQSALRERVAPAVMEALTAIDNGLFAKLEGERLRAQNTGQIFDPQTIMFTRVRSAEEAYRITLNDPASTDANKLEAIKFLEENARYTSTVAKQVKSQLEDKGYVSGVEDAVMATYKAKIIDNALKLPPSLLGSYALDYSNAAAATEDVLAFQAKEAAKDQRLVNSIYTLFGGDSAENRYNTVVADRENKGHSFDKDVTRQLIAVVSQQKAAEVQTALQRGDAKTAAESEVTRLQLIDNAASFDQGDKMQQVLETAKSQTLQGRVKDLAGYVKDSAVEIAGDIGGSAQQTGASLAEGDIGGTAANLADGAFTSVTTPAKAGLKVANLGLKGFGQAVSGVVDLAGDVSSSLGSDWIDKNTGSARYLAKESEQQRNQQRQLIATQIELARQGIIGKSASDLIERAAAGTLSEADARALQQASGNLDTFKTTAKDIIARSESFEDNGFYYKQATGSARNKAEQWAYDVANDLSAAAKDLRESESSFDPFQWKNLLDPAGIAEKLGKGGRALFTGESLEVTKERITTEAAAASAQRMRNIAATNPENLNDLVKDFRLVTEAIEKGQSINGGTALLREHIDDQDLIAARTRQMAVGATQDLILRGRSADALALAKDVGLGGTYIGVLESYDKDVKTSTEVMDVTKFVGNMAFFQPVGQAFSVTAQFARNGLTTALSRIAPTTFGKIVVSSADDIARSALANGADDVARSALSNAERAALTGAEGSTAAARSTLTQSTSRFGQEGLSLAKSSTEMFRSPTKFLEELQEEALEEFASQGLSAVFQKNKQDGTFSDVLGNTGTLVVMATQGILSSHGKANINLQKANIDPAVERSLQNTRDALRGDAQTATLTSGMYVGDTIDLTRPLPEIYQEMLISDADIIIGDTTYTPTDINMLITQAQTDPFLDPDSYDITLSTDDAAVLTIEATNKRLEAEATNAYETIADLRLERAAIQARIDGILTHETFNDYQLREVQDLQQQRDTLNEEITYNDDILQRVDDTAVALDNAIKAAQEGSTPDSETYDFFENLVPDAKSIIEYLPAEYVPIVTSYPDIAYETANTPAEREAAIDRLIEELRNDAIRQQELADQAKAEADIASRRAEDAVADTSWFSSAGGWFGIEPAAQREAAIVRGIATRTTTTANAVIDGAKSFERVLTSIDPDVSILQGQLAELEAQRRSVAREKGAAINNYVRFTATPDARAEPLIAETLATANEADRRLESIQDAMTETVLRGEAIIAQKVALDAVNEFEQRPGDPDVQEQLLEQAAAELAARKKAASFTAANEITTARAAIASGDPNADIAVDAETSAIRVADAASKTDTALETLTLLKEQANDQTITESERTLAQATYESQRGVVARQLASEITTRAETTRRATETYRTIDNIYTEAARFENDLRAGIETGLRELAACGSPCKDVAVLRARVRDVLLSKRQSITSTNVDTALKQVGPAFVCEATQNDIQSALAYVRQGLHEGTLNREQATEIAVLVKMAESLQVRQNIVIDTGTVRLASDPATPLNDVELAAAIGFDANSAPVVASVTRQVTQEAPVRPIAPTVETPRAPATPPAETPRAPTSLPADVPLIENPLAAMLGLNNEATEQTITNAIENARRQQQAEYAAAPESATSDPTLLLALNQPALNALRPELKAVIEAPAATRLERFVAAKDAIIESARKQPAAMKDARTGLRTTALAISANDPFRTGELLSEIDFAILRNAISDNDLRGQIEVYDVGSPTKSLYSDTDAIILQTDTWTADSFAKLDTMNKFLAAAGMRPEITPKLATGPAGSTPRERLDQLAALLSRPDQTNLRHKILFARSIDGGPALVDLKQAILTHEGSFDVERASWETHIEGLGATPTTKADIEIFTAGLALPGAFDLKQDPGGTRSIQQIQWMLATKLGRGDLSSPAGVRALYEDAVDRGIISEADARALDAADTFWRNARNANHYKYNREVDVFNEQLAQDVAGLEGRTTADVLSEARDHRNSVLDTGLRVATDITTPVAATPALTADTVRQAVQC